VDEADDLHEQRGGVNPALAIDSDGNFTGRARVMPLSWLRRLRRVECGISSRLRLLLTRREGLPGSEAGCMARRTHRPVIPTDRC